MGDAERTPLAEAGRSSRAARERRPPRSRSRRRSVAQRARSSAVAELAKPISRLVGSPLSRERLVQRLQPLGIFGPAIAQMRAEHFLQVGEAGEAERLGEAHQRRGLHLGARATPEAVPSAISSGCSSAKIAACRSRLGRCGSISIEAALQGLESSGAAPSFRHASVPSSNRCALFHRVGAPRSFK